MEDVPLDLNFKLKLKSTKITLYILRNSNFTEKCFKTWKFDHHGFEFRLYEGVGIANS